MTAIGIEVSESRVSNATKHVNDGPVVMLNLLRFAQTNSNQGLDGKSLYMTGYVPAFNAVAERVAPGKVTVRFLSTSVIGLVSSSKPSGYWHAVALVAYPSFDAFKAITSDAEYIKSALPHRLAALDDWTLVAMQES
ncbi:hypothetical protein ANO11243_093200 [Dothideomycetidae sp. 11243]|nr:hypothetical protein ANO11243_093200 [fungal sp. No.11243]